MPARPLSPISVIIPARNEAESIRLVLSGLPISKLHEIIVVDNGSTDRTSDEARNFAPNVRVVREDRPGYGQACLTGIAHLSPEAEIVVFIDADYSDHGGELLRVAAPILRGRADFVVGSRARGNREPGSMTPPQLFGNWLATSLIRLIWGFRWTDLGPFRAIDRKALDRLGMEDRNFGWTVEMQIKAVQHKLLCKEVPVSYRRRVGVSKISGTVSGTFRAGYKIIYTILKYGLAGKSQR